MTTATQDKYDFIGCLYPGKTSSTTFATTNLRDMKNRRYLVEIVGEGLKMYVSKIGNLQGKQIRDLDNYDYVTEFVARESKWGKFYVSMPDETGKCFVINAAKEDKAFTYILRKEKEAYVKPAEDTPSQEPAGKPLREFV